MDSKFKELKKEVKLLNEQGEQLYLSMFKECGELDEDTIKDFEKKGTKFISVNAKYQSWYTKAFRVIKQVIPERLNEFEKLYKGDEKRKEITYMNYSIYDYLVGLQSTSGSRVLRSKKDAIHKMEAQWLILSSAVDRFESSLFDIKEVLQADIFDSELDTATELNKKGFVRAGGAVAGVVLEKHLAHACSQHDLKSRKANPTISEYNQLLKDNEIIDTSIWRFIQHLGDIRNLCDHHKDREPTKDEVSEFIIGIEKIIKTVY